MSLFSSLQDERSQVLTTTGLIVCVRCGDPFYLLSDFIRTDDFSNSVKKNNIYIWVRGHLIQNLLFIHTGPIALPGPPTLSVAGSLCTLRPKWDHQLQWTWK